MSFKSLKITVASAAAFAVGAVSAATMTQLIDGPSDVRVAPLVQASWAQQQAGGQNCYNSKTPNNYSCGCVATAAGQIMRKWRHPAAAAEKVTNTECAIDGTTTSQTMLGGPGASYDWDSMPLDPANESGLTTAQCEAIGTLLYDIGVAVGMNWTSNGSSSYSSALFEQFTSTFGYANAAIAGNASGTGLSLEQFTQAVLPSLDAGMPVVVGIGGENTAHSVLCDGYGYENGDLYIHINMGMATESSTSVDYNNTWYKFPTNNPDENGVSLWTGGEQSYLNPVVYNISPTMQKGWSVVSGRILSGGAAVEGAEVVAINASGEGVAVATSNAKGIYALALPAGTYTLRAVDSNETQGARRQVTVVATEGTRSDNTATGVVIGNQHGVDIALADIASDFLADETPDAYLDYVQTDSNQYVDTGVIGKAGTKAEIDMMWGGITSSSDNCFLGSRNGSGGRFILCHTYKMKWNLGYSGTYKNNVATSPAPAVSSRYRVQTEVTTAGMYNFSVSGSSYTSDFTEYGNYNSTFSMYLFALQGQTSGTASNKSPSGTRCYSTRIWQMADGGSYRLLRDFVPCRKNGVAGLYDKVTRTIFYSRSGTNLSAGNEISIVSEPDAYLDYVESDGSQYVDTGVVGGYGLNTVARYLWLEKPGNETAIMLGSATGSGDNSGNCEPIYTWNTYLYYDYGNNHGYYSGVSGSASYIPVNKLLLQTNVMTNQMYLTVSGGTQEGADITRDGTEPLDSTFTTGQPMYIFASNRGGTAKYYAKGRIYSLQIYELNGAEWNLVRDFVPCKKDGVAGLYDKATKSIFVSKSGTPLIAGNVIAVVEEPDEYLDYVESDGNQYVDTGVIGKAGTKASLEYKFTGLSSTTESTMLGSSSGSGTNMFYLASAYFTAGYIRAIKRYNQRWGYIYWQPAYSAVDEYTAYSLTSEISTNGVWNGTFNGNANDETDYSANGVVDTRISMFAFAANDSGTAAKHSCARLYSMTIEQVDDNGEYKLVRDYVPCRKDGEPGLYDKVTKAIFYSKGTKPLIAGMSEDYPDEILDYVESTGSQYIDTGIEAGGGTKADFKMRWTEDPANDWMFLGARANNNSNRLYYLYTYKKYFYYGFGTSRGYVSPDFIPATDTDYTFSVELTNDKKWKATVSGNNYSYNCSDSEAVNPGVNMFLFACNDNGTSVSMYSKARCYFLKIMKDGVLVRDFVPCKKDGVAGLYDRVSKTIFYSNTSTALVAGNTIAKRGQPDSFVEYVESDGTQYIDTGVNGRSGTKAEMTFSANSENGSGVHLLGAYANSTYLHFCYFGSKLNAGFGSDSWNLANTYAKETTYTLGSGYALDKEVWLNFGTYSSTTTASGGTDSGENLYAFARNNGGTADGFCNVKLYSMKIWQTDDSGDYQLKRDFMPCVKDGKAALYDSITGMIYYPQGGDLTASEDEAAITSARWIGGTASSAADFADTSNWKCWQGGLVVYGKTPVTVSDGEATLICPVTLGDAADWSAAGVVTLASGATIDLNGHDLVSGGFAAAEGASVRLTLTVGSRIQFTGGVAPDLSGAILTFADPENISERFVFVTSDAAIAGKPKVENLPKGWRVKKSADGMSLSIARFNGMMAIVR